MDELEQLRAIYEEARIAMLAAIVTAGKATALMLRFEQLSEELDQLDRSSARLEHLVYTQDKIV